MGSEPYVFLFSGDTRPCAISGRMHVTPQISDVSTKGFVVVQQSAGRCTELTGGYQGRDLLKEAADALLAFLKVKNILVQDYEKVSVDRCLEGFCGDKMTDKDRNAILKPRQRFRPLASSKAQMKSKGFQVLDSNVKSTELRVSSYIVRVWAFGRMSPEVCTLVFLATYAAPPPCLSGDFSRASCAVPPPLPPLPSACSPAGREGCRQTVSLSVDGGPFGGAWIGGCQPGSTGRSSSRSRSGTFPRRLRGVVDVAFSRFAASLQSKLVASGRSVVGRLLSDSRQPDFAGLEGDGKLSLGGCVP